MKKLSHRFPLNLFAVLSVCVFLLLPAGCQSDRTKVQFRLFQDKIITMIDRLVMTGKIYRDLDTVFVGDLLWYTPELKNEYIDEMLKKGRMEQSEYNQQKAEIEKQASKEMEFLGAFYTFEDKWNDFDSPDSIWKLRLVDKDGNLVAPISVKKIKRKDMPDTNVFAFINYWKTIYIIKFAKTANLEGMDAYRVRLFSVLGDTEFVWKTGTSTKTN